MLSEEEKKEMRSLGSSSAIREEFRQLRAEGERPINVDEFLNFLTTMSRLRPEAAKPRKFVPYSLVRL